jgi:hypothetical protein
MQRCMEALPSTSRVDYPKNRKTEVNNSKR